MSVIATSVPIAYRAATGEDMTFVISSWLDSFRDSHTAGMISMASYFEIMWPQVEALVDRPGSRTIVACNAGDARQLHGFITFDTATGSDPPIVHYVYVKSPFRRWGIARGLFAAAGIDPERPLDYTYKTAIVVRLARKIPLARWQPMLARFEKGAGIRR